jgi:hypothetical protein
MSERKPAPLLQGTTGRHTRKQWELKARSAAWHRLYDLAIGKLVERYGLAMSPSDSAELAAKMADFAKKVADASVPVVTREYAEFEKAWDEAYYEDEQPGGGG